MIICKRATPDNNNNNWGDGGEVTRVTGVTGQKEEMKEKEKEEKKFLHTGTQTDQSKGVQEVRANLKRMW